MRITTALVGASETFRVLKTSETGLRAASCHGFWLLGCPSTVLAPAPSRQASVVLLLYIMFVRQQAAGMTRVSVSDLRQNLPAFLKRVQAGEQLQITSRGRVIARIEPERDPAEEARQWLLALRDRVSLGDVVSPVADLEWSGDANHL